MVVCPARNQVIELASNGQDEWRILEQKRQQRREKKEAVGKAKEVEEKMEAVAMAGTKGRQEEKQSVTDDREDGDLRMHDNSEAHELQGLETSRHARIRQKTTTSIVNKSSVT